MFLFVFIQADLCVCSSFLYLACFQYRFTNLLPYFKIKPFSARDIHTLKQTTRCDHVKSSVPSQVCVCALFCFFFSFAMDVISHPRRERRAHGHSQRCSWMHPHVLHSLAHRYNTDVYTWFLIQ